MLAKESIIDRPIRLSLLNEGVLEIVREAAGRRPVILTFAELLNTLERKPLV